VKAPRLKSPRLLPVVIFAALALLVFKGIGLVTSGGYVLTGTQTAVAAEAPAADAATAPDTVAPDVANAVPHSEPTMSDTTPTINDTAPTISKTGDPASPDTPPAAPAGTANATAAADAAPAAPAAGAAAATPAPGSPTATGTTIPSLGCPTTPPAADAAPATAPAAGTTTDVSPANLANSGCATSTTDAVPMHIDASGHKVPLASANGGSLTQDVVLQRLAERRGELDKREAALNMREAIVQAAEKQMQDRADALKSLETQIAALADQKKAAEDAQFVAIVNMYETMKPQEAAAIFNGLDMSVLARVAKAMNPRKMAPVLAKMTSAKAQELTTRLAAEDTPPVAAPAAPTDPNALPQIVGH